MVHHPRSKRCVFALVIGGAALSLLAGCAVQRYSPSAGPSTPQSSLSTPGTPSAVATSVSVQPSSPAPSPTVTFAAADPALAAKLAGLLTTAATPKPAPVPSVLSVVVADASGGAPLYAKGAEAALIPASTQKVLTSMAALSILGPQYRFSTTVSATATPVGGVLNGDLYLYGDGDPTTDETDYVALANAVSAVGIKTVTGSVIVDASAFDDVDYNDNWGSPFPNVSRPPVEALTVSPATVSRLGSVRHVGSVEVSYAGAATEGKPAVVTLKPASASAYVKIDNKSKTTKAGRNLISLARAPGSNTITVTGSLAVANPAVSWPMTVENPALYAGAVFKSALASAGVTVKGAVVRGTKPADATQLGAQQSAPLSQIVHDTLKESNNGYAEHLVKALGRTPTSPGSWASGTARVRDWLSSSGIPTDGIVLLDGSGFSGGNRVSARTLVGALQYARGQAWFNAFYDGLPVAGVDDVDVAGTLAKRLVGTPAAGNLRAKTGTLNVSRSLAGYVTGADGRPYAFAIIGNDKLSSVLAYEDAVAILLATWRS